MNFGGYFHPFPVRKNIKVIEQAERTLKRPIDVVMWYQQWEAPFGIKRFHREWIETVGERDVVIKWEPKKRIGRLADPRFALTGSASW
ncbi:MAG TPA: hypothetical protein VGS19_20760 [Streptosporangiaceae bacterium]|nr:hypothetical protein [Streptosporangiaceae bacterium]